MGGAWTGFAAYHRALTWLMNVSVRPSRRRTGIAATLLRRGVDHLPPGVDSLKLIDVVRSDTGTLAWASAMGFESHALQSEMAPTIGARITGLSGR